MILDLLNDWNRKESIFYFQVSNPEISIFFDVIKENYSDREYVAIQLLKGLMILCKNHNENNWHNVDLTINNQAEVSINLAIYLDSTDLIDVIIYGPIYHKTIKKLTVTCESGRIMKKTGTPCVVMGGNDSFGIGCTSSALKFSNILERKNNLIVSQFTYNQDNYLESLKNCGHFVASDFKYFILELNNQVQIDELISFIKSLSFDFLFIWYYKSKNEDIQKLCQEVNNITFLSDESSIKESTANNIFLCNLAQFDEEFFHELCTINSEILNDSGNVHLYKIIQKVIGDVKI